MAQKKNTVTLLSCLTAKRYFFPFSSFVCSLPIRNVAQTFEQKCIYTFWNTSVWESDNERTVLNWTHGGEVQRYWTNVVPLSICHCDLQTPTVSPGSLKYSAGKGVSITAGLMYRSSTPHLAEIRSENEGKTRLSNVIEVIKVEHISHLLTLNIC